MKDHILDQIMMQAPKGSECFVIACDAFDNGMNAVLLQVQNGEEVLLEFASKSFTKVEQNWPAHVREGYAIRWSVEKFSDYVKINGATILTDNSSLKWMFDADSRKVKRWALYLHQFQLVIKHIDGRSNVLADWLSRLMPEGDHYNDNKKIIIPEFVVTEDKAADSEENSKSKKYIMSQNSLVPFFLTYKKIVESPKRMKVDDNILKEIYLSEEEGIRYSNKTHKIYIPEELQNHFIYWMHCSKHGGHAGINRTTNRLKKWLWWPKMRTKIADFISGCLQCIRYKPIQRPQTVRGVLSKPEPFELISLDFVGPRKWKGDNRYYLCIIDHYSKYVVLSNNENAINSRDIIY